MRGGAYSKASGLGPLADPNESALTPYTTREFIPENYMVIAINPKNLTEKDFINNSFADYQGLYEKNLSDDTVYYQIQPFGDYKLKKINNKNWLFLKNNQMLPVRVENSNIIKGNGEEKEIIGKLLSYEKYMNETDKYDSNLLKIINRVVK